MRLGAWAIRVGHADQVALAASLVDAFLAAEAPFERTVVAFGSFSLFAFVLARDALFISATADRKASAAPNHGAVVVERGVGLCVSQRRRGFWGPVDELEAVEILLHVFHVGKRKGFLVLLANRAVGQRVAHLAEVQVILQLDAAINVHFVADFFIELRLDGPAGLARAVFLLHARAYLFRGVGGPSTGREICVAGVLVALGGLLHRFAVPNGLFLRLFGHRFCVSAAAV